MSRILIAAALTMGASVSNASAHHSFAAEYDATKPIKLTGTVQRVDLVNPHSWIYIQVKEPNGKPVTWNVEMGSPNSLIRRGFTKNSVPAGTQVIVDGYRAKDGSRTVNSSSITLSDGRRLFTGSPGTGAPRDTSGK